MKISKLIRKFKYDTIAFIAKRPRLFVAYYSLRHKYRPLVVTSNTQILIEGFPRSANTYAVLAFENAQPRRCIIAHHLHAEAQLILAKKYSIPAIVLVREPIEAISSLLNRDKSIDIEKGVQRYIDFYSCVLMLKNYVLLASFSTVVSDFEKIISACNQRFETDFQAPVDNEKEEVKVFSQIAEHNRIKERGDLSMIAIPHASKNITKEELRLEVKKSTLLPQAEVVFDELIKISI